jgi:hypothetical protein
MRKTLLGKRTIHGTSALAAKIMSERALVKGKGADDKAQEAFSKVVSKEELMAVGEELKISGLNYAVLTTRVMRKWRFYTSTTLLMLFAAFPCRQKVVDGMEPFRDGAHIELADYNSYDDLHPLPVTSVWYYVPPRAAVLLDPALFNSATADVDCETIEGEGWPAPTLHFTWHGTPIEQLWNTSTSSTAVNSAAWNATGTTTKTTTTSTIK